MLQSQCPTRQTSYSTQTLAQITEALQQHMLPCLTPSATIDLRATCKTFYQAISSAPRSQVCKALSALLPKELHRHAKTGAHLLFMLTKQQAAVRDLTSGRPGHVSHVQMPNWFGAEDPVCMSHSWPSLRLAICCPSWRNLEPDCQGVMHVVDIDEAVLNSPEPAPGCTIRGLSDLRCDWFCWIRDDGSMSKTQLSSSASVEAQGGKNKAFCGSETSSSLGDTRSARYEQPSVTQEQPTFSGHWHHLLAICYRPAQQPSQAAGEMQAIPNQLWLHSLGHESRSSVLHFWIDSPGDAACEGEMPVSGLQALVPTLLLPSGGAALRFHFSCPDLAVMKQAACIPAFGLLCCSSK